jgi:putative membrane protein
MLESVRHGLGTSRRGFIRWIFAGVLGLLLVGLVLGVLSFAGHFGGFFYGPGYYYGWPFFFFPFGFFIFIGLLFFVFRWAFWGWGWRRGYYRGYWTQGASSALEILNQRYARGEITREQYEQIKADILREE